MIRKGTYKARGVDWMLGYSRNGNEQIGVLLQLDTGESITWYGFFTEKCVERTLESMEHLGWDGQSITNPVGLDQNDVSVVIEEETNQEGKTYPKVRWINKIGGGIAMKEELTGPALEDFRQRMQGTLLARRQNRQNKPPLQQGQRKPSQPPPVRSRDYPEQEYGFPPADREDDLPF